MTFPKKEQKILLNIGAASLDLEVVVVVAGTIFLVQSIYLRALCRAAFWRSISLRVSELIYSFGHRGQSWDPMNRGWASKRVKEQTRLRYCTTLSRWSWCSSSYFIGTSGEPSKVRNTLWHLRSPLRRSRLCWFLLLYFSGGPSCQPFPISTLYTEGNVCCLQSHVASGWAPWSRAGHSSEKFTT